MAPTGRSAAGRRARGSGWSPEPLWAEASDAARPDRRRPQPAEAGGGLELDVETGEWRDGKTETRPGR